VTGFRDGVQALDAAQHLPDSQDYLFHFFRPAQQHGMVQ
jgi:hypothetical protein